VELASKRERTTFAAATIFAGAVVLLAASSVFVMAESAKNAETLGLLKLISLFLVLGFLWWYVHFGNYFSLHPHYLQMIMVST
jgi:hypothetical protein